MGGNGEQDLTTMVTRAMLETLSRLGKLTVGTFYKQVRKRLSDQYRQILEQKGGDSELQRIRYYLKRKNYIEVQGRGREASINITDRGQARLSELNAEIVELSGQKEWDGKWRMVTFDIPESKRSARDALRRQLKNIGFRQLHRSLWVYPLPCRSQISQIAERYEISQHVTFLEVENFDHSQKFRQKFKNII